MELIEMEEDENINVEQRKGRERKDVGGRVKARTVLKHIGIF